MVLVVAAALAGACGGKKDEEPASTGSANAPAAPGVDRTIEVLSGPRKAVTARAGATEITIDLPEAASAPQLSGETAMFAFEGSSLVLSVQTAATPVPPDALEKKKTLADPKAEQLLRADQTAGNAYVVAKMRKDRTWLMFEHCRGVASGSLCCSASLSAAKPYAPLESVIGLVADICQHVTAGGEPHTAPTVMDHRRPPG